MLVHLPNTNTNAIVIYIHIVALDEPTDKINERIESNDRRNERYKGIRAL